ncbi:Non-specific protein-tyrosine kinase [Aphelenchoides fujianensis]|nr:Non-specific protein-tyrosine kinase [Aphelenchoides fujianensis]
MMRRSLSPELASLKANQANRDRENRGLRADERRNGGPPVGKPLFSLQWMGGGVGYRTFDLENHFVGAHLADETLLEQDFYHGILTRNEVEERVTRDGEFLVCIPNEQPHNQFVIAIATRFLYELRFFVVKKAPGGFHVHEKFFASIPQLVEHYVKQRESLDQQLPVLIHTAVPVPDWVITHDRVWLEDMIGTGVLLYEIFSNGAEPYPKISAADVRSALAGDSGFRMELPAEIPAKVVLIIEECWNETPRQRPSFLELHGDLKELKF